ncbi:growth-regulating factor 3-like isoform X1 [Olea europaea var. sylvestris]|uniref:growth-regulating factor 3-like isoform X1 n=1 Tax=Olea europaea var. sylvestris TaxID=158386 RepID=UPI000C1D89C2|nr:growth-regulating factor 3-like isoform X1 [Olea europaea var. sylvestris]
MDFNLKKWRDQHESEEEQQQIPSAKLPRLLLNSHPQQPPGPALPLFVPNLTSNLSAYSSDSTTTSANKAPWMGSYFSLAQWQELELQALIYKHMIAGAAVPSELLHLVKKSLINSPSPPYYLSQHYYPHYQPGLLQPAYWGKGAMDPEPGRCRRTDGKKWRCSRDVVAGQKYCERHVHRGRNRSRKPVEIHTSTTTPYSGKAGNNGDGEVLKTSNAVTREATGGGGGTMPFSLSGPSPSMDLLHFNQRPSESIIETKGPFVAQNNSETGGRTLRHFFDDWPRSLQETDNATSSMASATNLSISMGMGNPSSDFSLKLSTGDNGDDSEPRVINGERDRLQLNWGAPWGTNQVAPMGGPLAEALRSSTSNSSPTSVLHQLRRGSVSEASYVGA